MKAIVQETYGSPDRALRLEGVDRSLIGDDDVLIQLRATSVNTPDGVTVIEGDWGDWGHARNLVKPL